jgi:hypothetical protein
MAPVRLWRLFLEKNYNAARLRGEYIVCGIKASRTMNTEPPIWGPSGNRISDRDCDYLRQVLHTHYCRTAVDLFQCHGNVRTC